VAIGSSVMVAPSSVLSVGVVSVAAASVLMVTFGSVGVMELVNT
jgi:hypothetical protein